MKKLGLTFEENFEGYGIKIIIPDYDYDNNEIKNYLDTKLNKDISIIFYDSLSESKYDGYISTEYKDYNFYCSIYNEL